ncbi:MAG: TIGR03746 family integrating conjugative element protein [Azoarcus sp.]|jgi:integrating conjugative element protein (TIGR03746 family)|nr:TIGR03746 family integrating conjugative element protein [Azoarcus sp.]
MSRFTNEVEHLRAHAKTLRGVVCALFFALVLALLGWWNAPSQLTIHVPPDLRSGSTRMWWDIPPENVYAFAFYIWQQLHRWPTDGEADYARNIRALSAYFTPSCQNWLESDFAYRKTHNELRQRVRGIYEIPGRGYGDDPSMRLKTLSKRDWVAVLDVSADEYFGTEQVKRALVRYRVKVAKMDADPEKNPFGMMIDCLASEPERIEATEAKGAPSP